MTTATAKKDTPSALLLDLLTRAAGFDPRTVQVLSIDCHVAAHSGVTFDVKLQATEEMVQKAFNEMADESFALQLGAVANMLGNNMASARDVAAEAEKKRWMDALGLSAAAMTVSRKTGQFTNPP
jgi:hypothetical protein